jgi:alcohol dehydrogenase class IV
VRTLAEPSLLERAAVLISGEGAIRKAVASALSAQGLSLDSIPVLSKPAGEPTREAVDAAATWLGGLQAATVIAIGGGSTLDWARLALAASKGWLDVGTGAIRPGLQPGDRPRLVLVPTTCGSGAEASAVAVYTLNSRKVAVVSDAFLADRVVLDAQFLATASHAALASWVSDALSHAVESFVSIVPNGLAKQAAIGALHTILQHFAAEDFHCRRERLMEAGYLGGVAASNCSVGVVHAFAHSIAPYGVPHGVGNALGLAAGIRSNADTAEMRALLDRMGLPAAGALVDAIAPMTSAALAGSAAARARAALGNRDEREAVLARMLSDVCLRTNPRRLGHDDLVMFLDDVERVRKVA